MRILVVSQYFWPESFVINDLVRALALEGHRVTVATGKPNYPAGRIYTGYTQAGTSHEFYAGNVEVFRIPLRPRGKAGAAELFFNYLSFIVSGLLYFPRLLRDRDFDIVLFFGVSPPTSAIPAAFLAWRKKAHLAYWIQDLWPDSLASTGMIQSRVILWLVKQVMRILYRRADTILIQSEAFGQSISVHANPEKLVYFPNPAPMDDCAEETLPIPLERLLQNCFSVVFAGNLGRVQSLDTIIDAARWLAGHPHIRLIIAGTGSEAQRMQETIASSGLPNIILTGLIERNLMPAVFRRASALLVTLKNDPALGMVIPSKIQAYMQSGKPIVGALDGQGADLIQTVGCGLVTAAEDSKGLAKSILTLSFMPASKLAAMGLAGQKYFERHFEVRNAARRLITILQTRTGMHHLDQQ